MDIYIIGGLFFPFINSLLSCFSYLLGKQSFKEYSKYLSINYMIVYVATIVAIFLSKNIIVVILTYLISQVLSEVIFYFIIKTEYHNDIIKSKKDKGLFKLGFHLSLVGIIPLISSQVDKIFIGLFMGFEDLAIYAIAVSIPSQLKLITKPLSRMLLPKFAASKDMKSMYIFLKKKLILMLIVSIVIILIGIMLLPFVIKLLFPPEYSPAIFYAQIAFIAFIFTIITNIFTQYLVSQKNTKGIFWMNLWGDCSKLVLILLLVPLFGILGAIGALAISNYIRFILSWYYSHRTAMVKC